MSSKLTIKTSSSIANFELISHLVQIGIASWVSSFKWCCPVVSVDSYFGIITFPFQSTVTFETVQTFHTFQTDHFSTSWIILEIPKVSSKFYLSISFLEWKKVVFLISDRFIRSRKFYVRRNNNKVDSIETRRIVIAHLLPWSDLEKSMYTTLF